MFGSFAHKNLTTAILIFLILFISVNTDHAQQKTNNKLSLIFIGDIMGHGPQITSAYIDSTKEYSYESIFKYIKNEVSDADYTIANLEVTLAGEPFKGYPRFSSPDALAQACKNNGIDAFVMSNNHSCDRGGSGIKRSIDVVDELGIIHTGTFKDVKNRDSLNLLIINKNNIKIGVLNYTYGTNGLPYPEPTYVNLIDTSLMSKDILAAKSEDLDKLIVFIHWGGEYLSQPDKFQQRIAKFLFNKKVDIIIGSHPHVLQKMIYTRNSAKEKESFIAYSLGNYVSNQRDRRKDGGCMVKLVLSKKDDEVVISEKGFILTWVYRKHNGTKNDYFILPCSKYESDSAFFEKEEDLTKMNIFINDSRKLLNEYNSSVEEYIYTEKKWMLKNTSDINKQ